MVTCPRRSGPGDCRHTLGRLFALAQSGLFIVDEEHDGSFKQLDGIRYHARDFALVRAKALDVPVLLGSAVILAIDDGHVLLVDALADLRDLPWQLTCIGSLERDPAAAAQLREGDDLATAWAVGLERLADHGGAHRHLAVEFGLLVPRR